jgi:hypothetical protein
MKYNVTFIEPVEGRDTITHGGVSFPVGKAVLVDSTLHDMSPWFEGNSSFEVEAVKAEAEKPAPAKAEEPAKVVPKRSTRKSVAK